MTKKTPARTGKGSDPSQTAVVALSLQPGLNAVLNAADGSGVDPRRLDILMGLASQERGEVLDTLRAWQQKTNITLAVLLALVPLWVAAPHRWLTIAGLAALACGFVLSVWALRPVKTFFPQVLGFIEHASVYAHLSPRTFEKGFLLDTATGLSLAHEELRKVTNASLGALGCAVASIVFFAINTGVTYAGA